MHSALNKILKTLFVSLLSFSMATSLSFAASTDQSDEPDATVDISPDQNADPSTAANPPATTSVTTVAAPASVQPGATTTTTEKTTTTTTPASTTVLTPATTMVPAKTTTVVAPAPAPTKTLNAPSVKAAYDKLLSDAGVTYEMAKPNLTISVDEKRALDALPALENKGMINGKIPASDVAAMPISISGALIGVSFTAVIIHTEFEADSSLDKLHVQVYLLPTGAKSDADKQLCYSFDFTRDLFNKTNWDTVTPKDIMLNSPNFKFSDWCQSAIDKESNVKS